jgi:membrane protein
MLKKWFTRVSRIASSTFGSAKEDGFSLETSLTKFERFVHFWVLVGRSFVRNRCPVRASALSYTTLLAMIPMLAVAMSITSAILKSEGQVRIKQFIEQFVDNIVPTASVMKAAPSEDEPEVPAAFTNELAAIQFDATNFLATYAATDPQSISNDSTQIITATNAAEASAAITATNAASTAAGVTQVKKNVSREAANMIYEFAEKSYSGALGVTGMIFLVLTAILTLTRVEETFNDIWGVTQGREWWSRITNYFFTISLGPVLIIAALGLANGPNFAKTRELMTIVPFIEPLISTYLPVLLICFTFAMFYKLVPNTRVDFSAALVGGSLAGISWYFYNKIIVHVASSAVSANAVYGGLFMIPLLMGGLYVVWLTVLFGAQVAYAFQNRASYLQDRLAENVNQRGREFVALRLMTFIGQHFHRGLPPATIREISAELGIPSRLVQQVLRTLLLAGLVVEVTGVESGFSPARPLEAINCHHILLAMRATHGQEPATRDEPARVEVLGEFARIQAAERAAASSVTMLALVNRAQARLELAAPVILQNEMELKPAATTVTPIILPPEQPIAEPTIVEFVEPEKEKPASPSAPSDATAYRAAVEPGGRTAAAPKPAPSVASADATATHENESFPL